VGPDGEYRWIEERFSRDSSKEGAFIADFVSGKDNQGCSDPQESGKWHAIPQI
jgi:hypothetical protein